MKNLFIFIIIFIASYNIYANVIGQDDRVPMLSSQYPWSAIGRIEIGNQGICSATLIANDLILTAAHCLIDETTKTRYHTYMPVVFAPNFKENHSYHSAFITTVWLGTQETKKERKIG